MEELVIYEDSDNKVELDNIPSDTKNILGISRGVFVFLMVLTIIITCTLSTCIKSVSDYIIRQIVSEKNITITVLGTDNSPNGDIWILDVQWNEDNSLFSYCLNGEKNGIWEIRTAEEWGYNNDMILSYGENAGSSITFTAPAVPELYLMFWAYDGGGMLSVEVDGQIDIINTNSEVSMFPIVYPFKNSYISVVIRLLVFGVISAVIFIVLLLIYYFVIRQPSLKLPQLLIEYYKNTNFVLIWASLYLFAVIQYKIGIPNYLAFGDQVDYWGEQLLKLSAWWNPEVLANEIYSFRGYWCYILTMIAQVFGESLKIDPAYIYLIFTSLSLAWLVGYVLPEIYSVLSGKRAKRVNILLCTVVYLFFWNGTLTAVLMDLFGLTAFLTGILFAIKLFKSNKVWYGVPSGMGMSIACCFRSAYVYGIYVLIIYGICLCIYVILKKRRNLASWFNSQNLMIRKCTIGIALAVASFVVICIPQFQINMARGHIGLLPYDYDSSCFVSSYGETQASSLMIGSANFSLGAYTGFPMSVTDNQLLLIKESQFTRDDVLNMPQILSAYSTNFINTVVYLLKKLFMAFDVKTNISYPNDIPWNKTQGMVFSLLNYIVLASAVYVLLFDKNRIRKSERIFTALLFIGLTLPQMFVHVEWRYFISAYVLLYYFFSYHFVEAVSDSLGETKTSSHFKFLRYICIVLCLAFTISFSICA